ncbi:MAG: TolC family protein [Planctomycetes bacterium]|nr:TolC family protein [Planctomycetota bacterium]
MPAFSPRIVVLLSCSLLAGCWSPTENKESADTQVYDILERASAKVTGQPKTFPLERPVDTLRHQLQTNGGHLPDGSIARLSLLQALDVAAENSRDFQRQKETLYLSALNLTRNMHNFAFIFGGGGSAEVSGESDVSADARLSDDLSGSITSTAGTRVVASFVNTFLRSVVHGGSFDGSSILNLTLTQPLLRGAGSRIVREPLTQSERDVIYSVRSFERFRAEFAIGIASDYWNVVRQIADLANVEANYKSLVQSREQIEELYNAGRKTVTDLGRAKQSEYSADAQRVSAKNRLQTALDRFKLKLGLPVTAEVELDLAELDHLREQGVLPVDLSEEDALHLATDRRFDFQTTIDEVEDAGRRIVVAEDALHMALDFTAALNVPAESGKGLNLDWSKVNWSAGFELDLALDKLVERNAYRSALISFDVALRAREQAEDQIAADVRSSLRNIQSATDSYRIQSVAVELAAQRVEATTDLYAAGRVQALEKLDAQDALLQAQLDLTAAIVDYSVARLQLMHDLEAIELEPKGLRFDPALPVPQPKTAE